MKARRPSGARPGRARKPTVFERLDERLQANTRWSYAQRIDLLGRVMFGDDWNGRTPEPRPTTIGGQP